jgi:DNA-binding transcriptional MocR family regulator
VHEVISGIEQQLAEPTAKGLARAVSRAVREGTLTAGDRLPPIRDLARELALSPTTVSAAWALLVRSGTIETAGRRGTRVADPRQPRDGRYRQALEHQTTFALDLSTGIPDAALLPSLDRAVRQLTTAGTPASYLDEPVLPELHDLLAATWPYAAPTLTVVDGAMDGLELVIRTSLRYGDRVIVEHPTFPPLLDLLEAAGVAVAGVSLDEEGIVPGELESALEQPARALFVQPRAHNPTGVSMTARRARVLGRLLGRLPSAADLLVVEDDSANAISTSPDVSLAALLPDRTVHVRSFSKSHGPDLRLAAMSGPEELMASVRHLRQLGQGWSSRLLQRLLVGLLADERTQAEVVAAREEYARRRARFVERLAEHDVATEGTDGLNVWVPVHDEAAALMRLASLGIGVAPGAPFTVLPERHQHVRVTVGLVGERLEHVADEVARAARTGGRRSGAR